MHAVREIRAHADEYTLAESYWDGTVPELFCSAAVRRALAGALDGFQVNLARRAVDAVADRVQITAVSVPSDDAATRRLVDGVWAPNRLGRYSKRIHWAALTYGDSYMVIWPGDGDGTVECHFNSPVGTRVLYSPENPRLKAYAAKLWTTGERDTVQHRVTLYYADRVEKWATDPGHNGDEPADWHEHLVDDEPWPIPNPYGQVPVFHWRAGGEPYGRPEHRGAWGPQNAVTKLSSTMMSTVEHQAFPQRYALMQAGQTDQLFAADEDDDTLDPDERRSKLDGGPGTILNLPDATKVGQFDPADMRAFLDPISAYVRMMASATATPLRFFDPQGAIPSGSALRADEAPLTARIHDRIDAFTDEWQDALVFASLVAGEPIPVPDISWAPVQTADDLESWRVIEMKLALGVPFVQAMTEAGYASELAEMWENDRSPAPAVAPAKDEGSGTAA